MMYRPGAAAAQFSSFVRRPTGITAPVGNWWLGVTYTSRAPAAARASGSSPCSSTATGTQRMPLLCRMRRVRA